MFWCSDFVALWPFLWPFCVAFFVAFVGFVWFCVVLCVCWWEGGGRGLGGGMVFVPYWQTPTQTNPDRPRSSKLAQTGPNPRKPAQTCSNDPKPAHPNKNVCVCVCLSVLVRFDSVRTDLARLVVGAFYSGPLTSENVKDKLSINKFLWFPKS